MEVPLAESKPYFQQAVPSESGNYNPMSYIACKVPPHKQMVAY